MCMEMNFQSYQQACAGMLEAKDKKQYFIVVDNLFRSMPVPSLKFRIKASYLEVFNTNLDKLLAWNEHIDFLIWLEKCVFYVELFLF